MDEALSDVRSSSYGYVTNKERSTSGVRRTITHKSPSNTVTSLAQERFEFQCVDYPLQDLNSISTSFSHVQHLTFTSH